MAPPVAGVNGAWSCSGCQNVNFALRDACNRCQAPRPAAAGTQLKPGYASWSGGGSGGSWSGGGGGGGGAPVAGMDGNWACQLCGNVNFALRSACNRCQMPKESCEEPGKGGHGSQATRPAGGPVPTQAPRFAGGGGDGAPVAGVDGNWKCRLCSNVNYAGRVACNRCQAPKEAVDQQQNFGGNQRGQKPIAGLDGNWQCSLCQNVNFAVRAVCNRCQAPPPEAAQVQDVEGEELPPGYEDIFKELLQQEEAGQHAMEQLQRLTQARPSHSAGAPVAGVDGNWECPYCRNVNFAPRMNCNMCQMPKEPSADAPAQAEASLQPAGALGAVDRNGAPITGVDGNWFCAQCSNVNYASRMVCNRCSAPNPEKLGGGAAVGGVAAKLSVLEGPKGWPQARPSASGGPVAGVDGNWQCPVCQNVNYASRTSCNRCAAPMPSQPTSAGAPVMLRAEQAGGNQPRKGGAPMAGVDGNWQCAGCGNVNYGMRQVCNRCQAPKPDGFGGDEKAAEEQAAFAKLLQSSDEDLGALLTSHPEMFEAINHPAKRSRRDA